MGSYGSNITNWDDLAKFAGGSTASGQRRSKGIPNFKVRGEWFMPKEGDAVTVKLHANEDGSLSAVRGTGAFVPGHVIGRRFGAWVPGNDHELPCLLHMLHQKHRQENPGSNNSPYYKKGSIYVPALVLEFFHEKAVENSKYNDKYYRLKKRGVEAPEGFNAEVFGRQQYMRLSTKGFEALERSVMEAVHTCQSCNEGRVVNTNNFYCPECKSLIAEGSQLSAEDKKVLKNEVVQCGSCNADVRATIGQCVRTNKFGQQVEGCGNPKASTGNIGDYEFQIGKVTPPGERYGNLVVLGMRPAKDHPELQEYMESPSHPMSEPLPLEKAFATILPSEQARILKENVPQHLLDEWDQKVQDWRRNNATEGHTVSYEAESDSDPIPF